MKNKEKLALVDDYVKVLQILKFIGFLEKKGATPKEKIEKVKEETLKALKIKLAFDEIFVRNNMNDFSMSLLLRDLEQLDYSRLYERIDISKKLEDCFDMSSRINKKLELNYRDFLSNRQNLDIL